MPSADVNVSVDQWLYLVKAAQALEEDAKRLPPKEARKRAVRLLETVGEIFPRSLDPVADFEKYAVRQLAKGLLSALARERRGP